MTGLLLQLIHEHVSSLGKPEELIPTDIVSAKLQKDAVNDINAAGVDHRIRVWRDENGKLIAFISHFESMWSAFWFAPKGADYLYGATACCKDTHAVRTKIFSGGRYPCFASLFASSPARACR